MYAGFCASCADYIRGLFDCIPKRLGGVTVVGVLAALTAATGQAQTRFLERGCGELPVSLNRIQVTFSASRFASLVNAEGSCRANVVASFVTWDLVFPIFYGFLFSALFLWLERWRRFARNDEPLAPIRNGRRDAIVLAPLAAALLDIFVENIPLWLAAHLVSPDAAPTSMLVTALVMIGSAGALLKWVLLLLTVVGIVVELFSGPRGVVLWRVRFSGLAVLLGGVPLLAVPQGQDILQRIFEDEHPAWRLLSAVPPGIFTAIAVWYCSRRLTELRLDGLADDARGVNNGWFAFFAEQVPRLLGILLLALIGLAFATAGLAAPRFLSVVVIGFFVALLLRRFFSKPLKFVGRWFIWRGWRKIPGLDERVGRALVASLIGVFVFWPHWLPGQGGDVFIFGRPDDANESTLFYLRIAAYLYLVAGWMFQLMCGFGVQRVMLNTARPHFIHQWRSSTFVRSAAA